MVGEGELLLISHGIYTCEQAFTHGRDVDFWRSKEIHKYSKFPLNCLYEYFEIFQFTRQDIVCFYGAKNVPPLMNPVSLPDFPTKKNIGEGGDG